MQDFEENEYEAAKISMYKGLGVVFIIVLTAILIAGIVYK